MSEDDDDAGDSFLPPDVLTRSASTMVIFRLDARVALEFAHRVRAIVTTILCVCQSGSA